MTRKVRHRFGRSAIGLEWVAVIGIVALLAAIAVPLHRRYDARARVAEARERLPEIVEAARSWARAHRDPAGYARWPSDLTGDLGVRDTDTFDYEITAGAGERAASRPLCVEARGGPRRGLAGVRLHVLLPRLEAHAGPVTLTRH